MANMNIVALIGRLVREPELKKTSSGLSYSSFTVAVDRMSKEEECDFINCTTWRQSAEYLTQFAHKGDLISVNGRIQTRSYEKDGKTVWVTEVVAQNVSILHQKSREGTPVQTSYKKTEIAPSRPEEVADLDVSPDELPF